MFKNDQKSIRQSNDDLLEAVADSLRPLNRRSGCPSSVCCQHYAIPCDRDLIEEYLGNPNRPATVGATYLAIRDPAGRGERPGLSRRQLHALRLHYRVQLFLAETAHLAPPDEGPT